MADDHTMTDTTKPTGDTIAYAPNMDVSRMLNALRSYAHSGAKSAYQHDEVDAYVSNLSKIDAELRRLAERPNRAVARGDLMRFLNDRMRSGKGSIYPIYDFADELLTALTTPTETTDPAMERDDEQG